ncbi:B3 DNA binding domain-containing protein [Tanacetum coccineum]
MDEACEECTQNCITMHKQKKNPSPVATTFFKVMFGDDYSKVLVLPPRFAHSVQNKVGKSTRLEDSSGEKWDVNFSKVDGLLALGKGWNKFASEHKLKLGDLLVFHYIMESHFVVMMYGKSGCPEIRHFGISQRQTKETKQKNKLTEDGSPSNNGTNDHHYSKGSCSKSEQSQQIMQKKRKVTMPPNVETTHTDHIAASPSQPGTSGSEKEKSQISDQSEPLVEKANPDNMVIETHTTVMQGSMVDQHDLHLQDESRKNNLQTVAVGFDGGSKTNLADNMVSETHATVKQICSVDKNNLHLENENRKNDLQIEVVGSDGGSKKNLADNIVSETSTTVKQICSVEKDYLHFLDESIKNNLQTKVVGSDGSSKKNLVAGGGGSNGTDKNDTVRKWLAKEVAKRNESNVAQTEASNSVTRASVTVEMYKESLVTPNEATYSDSLKKRSRNDDNIRTEMVTPAKIQKMEPGTSAKLQRNDLDILANMEKYKPDTSAKMQKIEPDTLAKMQKIELDTLAKMQKNEPNISATPAQLLKKEPETWGSRLHNSGCPSTNTTIKLPKPTSKASEWIKKEPSTNHGSGSKPEDNKMGSYSVQTKETENALIRVKDEPEEYAESPQYSSTNSSFSAVMTSFKYLELPERVKWYRRSKVVLLRNGADLWPVLFETNLGIKALTQNWELFAKAKGIKPGDKCDFVIEGSEQYQRSACRVYSVHVTHK